MYRIAAHRGVVPDRSSPSRVITVDADPVHLAAAHHLVFADHRNIVLRLAGHHASVAAVATVQIDRHAPGITRVSKFLVKRIFLGRFLVPFVRERRILLVFLQRPGRQNLPAFHVEVILRTRQRIIIAGLADFAPGGDHNASELRTTYALNPLSVPVYPAALRPYPSGNTTDAVRLARQNPCRRCHFAVGKRYVDHIRKICPCSPPRDATVRQCQLLCRSRTHQRGVVPRQFRYRLRQFLQPAVIREAPVINRGIRPENKFEFSARRGLGGGNWPDRLSTPHSSPDMRVFATTPSCRLFRQNLSKSAPGFAVFRRSRTAS